MASEVQVRRCVRMRRQTGLLSDVTESYTMKGWLDPIVAAHRAAEGKSFTTSLPEVVGVSRPYDQLYFILNWGHWAKEADLEYQNRSSERHCYICPVGTKLNYSRCRFHCVRSNSSGLPQTGRKSSSAAAC